MSLRRLLTLVFLLTFLPLMAQTTQWWIGKPIYDIRFNNLQNISENELEPVVREYIGKTFTDTLSWDLQSKIFALDYFEGYSIEAVEGPDGQNSVIILFTVEERPVVGEIEIDGNSGLRDREILDVVLLKKGDIVNRNKIRLDVDAIKQLYYEKGYTSVNVEGRYLDPVEGESTVVFDINEGTQNRVKEVRFSGNSFGSSSTLRRLIDTKAQALFNSGIYQANIIEEDKQKILDYYWQRGYIDAAITDVTITDTFDESDNRTYLIITFFIEEGEQWTYGGMTFSGNTLYEDEDLSKLVRQKVGSVVNKTTLEIDFQRVSSVYYDDGYIYNAINKKEIRDEAEKQVSYEVTIVERGRAHIENIVIRGNYKTKEYVIFRELPFEVGDVFSRSKFIEGLGNLYNLQYFSNILPETPAGSADGLMDIILNIEEGKTIQLSFGVSFAGGIEGFPIIGFINWADKNFLGRGQEISLGAEASSLKQSLTFSFKENWLFNRRISGGVNLSYEHGLTNNVAQDILPPYGIEDPYTGVIVDADGNPVQDPDPELIGDEYDYDYNHFTGTNPEYAMSYDSHELSLGVNTGYTHYTNGFGRLGFGGGLSTDLSFITYDPNKFRPYSETVRSNLDTWQPIAKQWITANWDGRDIVYNPTSGYLLSQRFTFAEGLFGTQRDYVKSSTVGEAYFKLWDTLLFEDWPFQGILALHSGVSFVLPQLNGELNVVRSDLLYIDGMMKGRGWGFGSGRDDYYDGQSQWDSSIELRIPLMEQVVWLDTFASAVIMNYYDENEPTKGLEEFWDPEWANMKYTLGTGFRFVIPGLPLGFYFTKRFTIQDGSVKWEPGNTGGYYDFVLAFTQSFF